MKATGSRQKRQKKNHLSARQRVTKKAEQRKAEGSGKEIQPTHLSLLSSSIPLNFNFRYKTTIILQKCVYCAPTSTEVIKYEPFKVCEPDNSEQPGADQTQSDDYLCKDTSSAIFMGLKAALK